MSEATKGHEVTIFVNTREFKVPDDKIGYIEVVALSFPGTPPTANTYIVKYSGGPHGHETGVLVPGGEVKVKEGMSFRVTSTGES